MFMSDGQSYSGEDEMRNLREVISSRTSELLVKTISFGNADSAKLEALANAGGGEFLRAVGGIELKECFEKAFPLGELDLAVSVRLFGDRRVDFLEAGEVRGLIQENGDQPVVGCGVPGSLVVGGKWCVGEVGGCQQIKCCKETRKA